MSIKATGFLGICGICATLTLLWSPCARAQLFEDVAPQFGLDHVGTCGGPFWVDLDDDGDQDLLRMQRFGNPDLVYRNDGDHFTLLDDIGMSLDSDGGGANPMDFDRDGDLDIFVHCYSTDFMLMVNEDGVFENQTQQLGFAPRTGGRYRAWLDFNRDGWMDLLLSFTDGWKLYRNDSGTHFTDITETTNLPDIESTYFFAETDYDLDGDIDLYMTVIGGANHFYRNAGDNSFADATDVAGLSGISGNGACVWVDINHDKYPDLLTPDGNHHGIFLNNQDGTFTAMTVHGTTTWDWGDFPQGCLYAVADFDMDGDEDIYAARPGGCGAGLAANQFFRQDSQDGTEIWFTDIAPQLGMNFAEDGYPWVVDFDGDGDMDLYLAQQGHADRLFRNNAVVTTNRFEVRVLGPNGEQDRWHTRVELYGHSSDEILTSSELNLSNVSMNGFRNYFVADENVHYDLRLYFACGVSMLPDDHPELSDIVPAEVGHIVTVHMDPILNADPPQKLPGDFGLAPAFPNPFNAVTTITYNVSANGLVRISILSLEGRWITDLLDTRVDAGTHQITWDADGLASGIYFVRLEAGSQLALQKVILLK